MSNARADRKPDAYNDKPHALALSLPGVNRFRKGTYICTCGTTFTGMNQYERHRADKRKEEASSVIAS